MSRPLPQLNRPEYRVIFYHSVTRDIMKYKFMSKASAMDFYDKLDSLVSKPAIYKCERIL